MLTKELLEVEKRKPYIKPVYREPSKNISITEKVIDNFKEGEKFFEIKKRLSELETHENFKFIRGLKKILERKSVFEQKSPKDPVKLRETVFKEGYVTSKTQREKVLKKVGKKLDLKPKQSKQNLYSDRKKTIY